jgi:hypothetical protein
MNQQPVYPKENPEYRKLVLEAFYKKVRETNWGATDEDEYQGKPRGRKVKMKERIESKPRTKNEAQAVNKFFNYENK